MSDLVGNPEDRFSHVAARMVSEMSWSDCFYNAWSLPLTRDVKMHIQSSDISAEEIRESWLSFPVPDSLWKEITCVRFFAS